MGLAKFRTILGVFSARLPTGTADCAALGTSTARPSSAPHAVLRLSAAAWLLCAASCDLPLGGSSSDPATSTGGGVAMSQDDALAVAGSLLATARLSGALFDPSNPNLDANSAAFAKRVSGSWKASSPCVIVTNTTQTVSLDFGASGCPLGQTGLRLVGKVSLSAQVDASAAIVTAQLSNFGLGGGQTASGGASISAKPGQSQWNLGITTAMTAGSLQLNGGIDATVGQMTVNAQAYQGIELNTQAGTYVLLSDGKSKVNVTATDVVHEQGACWPSLGKIVFSSAGIESTVTFSSVTKTAGVAQWKPPLSLKSQDLELPAHGWNCQ